jgi:hypothetical protein
MIHLLHAGSELIKIGISKSIYKKDILLVDPTERCLFLKILRRIHINSFFPFKWLWINHLVNKKGTNIHKPHTVIIFDAPIWIKNLKYIKKKYKNSRLVFWFWNIVKDPAIVSLLKQYCDKVYTFDFNDSQKFDIKFHTQFYWNQTTPTNKKEYDFFFIGTNKGRISLLNRLICIFDFLKFSYLIIIVSNKRNRKISGITYINKNLPYENVVDYISKSNCLIEINQIGQSGITMRSLESLFHGKKLLTNNSSISSYDFYNKDNILIFDKDNINIDNGFIFKNSRKIDNQIISKYSIDSWLETLISV